MVIRKVLQIGNPTLKVRAKTVKNIKAEQIQEAIADLIDSMRYHKLVGMAAPQIGKGIRVFITEIRKTPTRNPSELDGLRVFINPEIIWQSKNEVIMYEGCGSVAYGKIFGPVKRPKKTLAIATDLDGKKFKIKAEGLLARVIQHEYDHLEGIEFLEKITDARKIMSKEEYLKRIKNSGKK